MGANETHSSATHSLISFGIHIESYYKYTTIMHEVPAVATKPHLQLYLTDTKNKTNIDLGFLLY